MPGASRGLMAHTLPIAKSLLPLQYVVLAFHIDLTFIFHQAIAVQDALCVRGYWNTPENYSKSQLLEWFKSQIKQVGLSELKDTLYFPQSPGITVCYFQPFA